MKIVLTELEDIDVYLPSTQEALVIEAALDANDKKRLHLELANSTKERALITEVKSRFQHYLQRNPQIEYIHIDLYDYLENDLDNLSHTCLSLLARFIDTHNVVQLSIEAKERDEVAADSHHFDGAYFFHLLYDHLRENTTLKYFSLEKMILDEAASAAIKSILALNQLEALTLKGSRLSVDSLIEGLAKNSTLKMLDLSSVRGFHGGDAKKLGDAIEKHPALVLLSLHHVNFRGKDIGAIAHLLKSNHTLQYLDFTNALIERDELILLAKALGENTGLKALTLSADESLNSQVNLGILNTSAQMFGRAFKQNSTLIYCNLMRSCVSLAGKRAFINGLSESESLIFLFSKDTKEEELFTELLSISDEKYEKLKSRKNMPELDRRWIELCKRHTEGLADMPLGFIAGSLGILDSSVLPEWPLLSLSSSAENSVSSSVSDGISCSSAETVRDAAFQLGSSESKEMADKCEEPVSRKRDQRQNENQVKTSGNRYVFGSSETKRRKTGDASFSPVNLDSDKPLSPQW